MPANVLEMLQKLRAVYREMHNMPKNAAAREIVIQACLNQDMWSDRADGEVAYAEFERSGFTIVPTPVETEYMFHTGLALR